jgi:hypothetical protein
MHNLQLNKAENRRDFLRGAARYGLLAALVGVSARAARRDLRARADQRCVNRGICSGCGAFATCGLPAALSAKQSQPGG